MSACVVCSALVPMSGARVRKTCSTECRNRLSSERMARTNRVHASKRMSTRNPMHRPGSKEKMIATLRAIGHAPAVRGGNGHGPTEAQRLLSLALALPMEVVVKTGLPRSSGYPSCYKLDLADPDRLVGIEVDGASHSASERKAQDRKKEAFLAGLGWTVLRVTNADVLERFDETTARLRAAVARAAIGF